MRDDNFVDDDEMDNNQPHLNGYNDENDDIDDEEEDFFNERSQNLPNVCRYFLFGLKKLIPNCLNINRIII